MKWVWIVLCIVLQGKAKDLLENRDSALNIATVTPSLQAGTNSTQLAASEWNYAILGFAVLGLVLGLFLLGLNIKVNKSRKVESEVAKAAERHSMLKTKQATSYQDDGLNYKASSESSYSPAQVHGKHGDITVQWKDGNVTSLYRDTAEDDV
nr:PREDICTED: organic solute transporter subunit beta [Latimeria chalumnae]|eukprot:XP_005990186.1 PREDICTED: organic solute transporter subunit beta [Latimeria chalumnae]